MSILKSYLIAGDAVEAAYYQLRNAGQDDRRLETCKKNMNRFFPEIPENEYTKLWFEDRIFKEVLKLVRNAFIKWYDWDPGEILINQKNQNSMNSYAVTTEDYPMFIHIDQLLESVTFHFMLVMLK